MVLLQIVCLVAAELVARQFVGRFGRPPDADPKIPTFHEYHPELGWQAKEGSYSFPSLEGGGKMVDITILPDSSRLTSDSLVSNTGKPEIVFVGGSFTFGHKISNSDTFAWKLQGALPEFNIVNHGTSAYGTYQSLLKLEELFSTSKKIKFVIYSLMDAHLDRNVATGYWIKVLNSIPKNHYMKVPYVSLAPDGALIRHEPESLPRWPLREHLALVRLTENAALSYKTNGRGQVRIEAMKGPR
jgi:hypothetical protein